MGSEEGEWSGGDGDDDDDDSDWKQGRQVASAACTLSDHEKWMACISLYLFLFLFGKKKSVFNFLGGMLVLLPFLSGLTVKERCGCFNMR